MKRTISILAGVLALLIGVAMILPALAKLESYGFILLPLVTGMLLATGGVSAAQYGIMKGKA